MTDFETVREAFSTENLVEIIKTYMAKLSDGQQWSEEVSFFSNISQTLDDTIHHLQYFIDIFIDSYNQKKADELTLLSFFRNNFKSDKK